MKEHSAEVRLVLAENALAILAGWRARGYVGGAGAMEMYAQDTLAEIRQVRAGRDNEFSESEKPGISP